MCVLLPCLRQPLITRLSIEWSADFVRSTSMQTEALGINALTCLSTCVPSLLNLFGKPHNCTNYSLFWTQTPLLLEQCAAELCQEQPSASLRGSPLNCLNTYQHVPLTRFIPLLLQKELQLPWERLHLLGYSLGAHVAGIAGDLTDHRISRITGEDILKRPYHVPLPFL